MKLDQQLKQIKIDGFVLSDDVVFEFFDRVKDDERNAILARAIRIGVLALMEDRLSSFLANTTNELGIELESLKRRLDMKNQTFHETTKKGTIGENDILIFLEKYFEKREFKDIVVPTGKVKGELKGNKTGDILAFVGGEGSDQKIAIECKFDKKVEHGEVDSNDIEKNRKDTAWSQLLEATVNRDASTSIIVFEKTLAAPSIIREVDGVAYIDNLGFVCVIDYQAGDYQNLVLSYNLARSLALRKDSKKEVVEGKFVNMLIKRLLTDIKDIQSIEKLVESNIENNKLILKKIKKSLLTIKFTQDYLEKYLKDGVVSKADLLEFYQREPIRTKFQEVSGQIDQICNSTE